MGEKVKFLKPQGTYLHIAPEDPLGPPFHEYEVFFFTVSIFKAFAVPSLNEVRDDIKSSEKIFILNQFKIAGRGGLAGCQV